jgi:hypothetical protein
MTLRKLADRLAKIATHTVYKTTQDEDPNKANMPSCVNHAAMIPREQYTDKSLQ